MGTPGRVVPAGAWGLKVQVPDASGRMGAQPCGRLACRTSRRTSWGNADYRAFLGE